MAGYVSRTAPGASSESFRENIQAIVIECVGKKLRHEDLERFDQERDEALRSIPKSVKPSAWCTEQNELYDNKCREYLQHVRPELHNAIDTIIDNLAEEFLTNSSSKGEVGSLRAPRTPLLASNGLAPRLGQFGPSQPRAPEADMDVLLGSASSPCRSETMLGDDVCPVTHRDIPTDLSTSAGMVGKETENGNPIGTTSEPAEPAPPRSIADILSGSDAPGPSKRRSGDEVTRKGGNKRQRRSPPNNNDASSGSSRFPRRRPIKLIHVKSDECVFKYSDLPGFYVLRCNQTKCKEKLGTDEPYYFRAHPFQWNRAMNHFGGPGHNIKETDLIVKKYAREVINATEERNISPKARQLHTPKTPNSELPGPSDAAPERSAPQAPLTPRSPSTSRGKGKQPVPVIDLDVYDDDGDDSLFVEEDAEGPPSSGSTAAEALLRSQPYPTRSRVSIVDAESVDFDDDEECDKDGNENNHDDDDEDEDEDEEEEEDEEDLEMIQFNKQCPPLGEFARRFARP